jgi:hypothetical protein
MADKDSEQEFMKELTSKLKELAGQKQLLAIEMEIESIIAIRKVQ